VGLGPNVKVIGPIFYFRSNTNVMFQVGLFVATPLLEECEDDTNTPEMGTWESSGTSKISEFNFKGQNTSS